MGQRVNLRVRYGVLGRLGHHLRMRIRPLTGADSDALAETVRQGFDSFREWAPPGWAPPPAPAEAERIREGLARPSTWGLLAIEGGRVAGHVAFTQAREWQEPRPDIAGLAHVWQLFVRRDWWGTGIAAELNRRAVAEAVALGYEAMRLYTPHGNARGRAFYEREGWSTDGIRIPEPELGLDLVQYRRLLT